MPRVVKKVINDSKKIQLKLSMCKEQHEKCVNIKDEINQEIKALQEIKELPDYYNVVLMNIANAKVEEFTFESDNIEHACELLTNVINLHEKLSNDYNTVQEIKEKVKKLVPKKEMRVVFNEEDLELPVSKPVTARIKYYRKNGDLVQQEYQQNRPIKPKYKRKLTLTEMSELEAKLLLKCLNKLRDMLADHAESSGLI